MKGKKYTLFFFICFALFLTGCSFQYRDTENSIETPTNIDELFTFKLGYNRESIIHELGKPHESTDNYLLYTDPYVLVGLDKNTASYVITNATKFKTEEGVKIGSTKEKVIETYAELDVYQYSTPNEDWLYYFAGNGVKVAFKLQENKVEQIATGVAPLATIFNLDENVEVADDKSIIKDSTYITFFENVELNNKKVKHADFLQHVSMGLVKKVPIPLGMELSEVERKYGVANYVWEDREEGATELWYKAFNCSLLVKDDETVISGIKCPVNLQLSDLETFIGDTQINGQNEITYKNGDHFVTFRVSDTNQVTYFILQ